MGADCEAVGFVAEALEVEQHRRIDRQVEFATVWKMECFTACMAVRAFGHADKADVLDADFLQRSLDRTDLAFAAVDQHEVWPVALIAVGVFLLRASEPPQYYLAHHCKVVARRGVRIFDIELAVLALDETLRSRDDHCTERVGALDMAVVVHLDAPWRFGEFEQVGYFTQQLALRRALRQPPVQCFFGVTLGLRNQPHTVAALRV